MADYIPVTILSPAYNKGKTIRRTFESLLRQTNYQFEWVIVNDGSTDDTQDIISTFHTDKFPIRIFNKENEGLNRTWNKGIKLSRGELIMRVDPDDFITNDAIEQVLKYKPLLDKDEKLCSVVFLTKFSNGKIVGTTPVKTVHRSNFIDYRLVEKAKGDRMEIVKKTVFEKYPMPEIEGEKFCLESVMWQNIAMHYDALYVPYPIYVREYNEASITSNLTQVMRSNPKGALLTYSKYIHILLLKKKEGISVDHELMTNGINYFRYGLCAKTSLLGIMKNVPAFITLLFFLPGLFFFLVDTVSPNFVNKILNLIRGNQLNK